VEKRYCIKKRIRKKKVAKCWEGKKKEQKQG